MMRSVRRWGFDNSQAAPPTEADQCSRVAIDKCHFLGTRRTESAPARRPIAHTKKKCLYLSAELQLHPNEAYYWLWSPVSFLAEHAVFESGVVGETLWNGRFTAHQRIDLASVDATIQERKGRGGQSPSLTCIHMSRIPAFEYGLLWGERSLRSVANLTRLSEANSGIADIRAGAMDGTAVLIP